MRSFSVAGRRVAVATAALLVLTLTSADTALGQAPARPADPAAIDLAIERGVRYLQQAQNPAGHWGAGTGAGSGKGWAIGYTALAGIALFECGVSPNDPGLKNAARVIRQSVNDLDHTYEVALAILFLDRMGDKKDRRSIQMLAARLLAGQGVTGGWGYKVPKLGPGEFDAVMAALRKMNPPPPTPVPSARERPTTLGLCIKASDDTLPSSVGATFDPVKGKAAALAGLTPGMRQLPVFQPLTQFASADPEKRNSEPYNPTTDNSNTHFATLAVWAARKHDMPVEQSLMLIAQRFRTSQGADGTWGYVYAKNGGGGSPALTCVALLGVAIGHVVDPDPAVRPDLDPKVVSGFTWLSKSIGAPVGTTANRPTMKDVGGLYYMWAMERVAVIYDIAKLDNKDWHLWGAEILLCHQKGEGNWADGGAHVEHPVLSTSLALLFLKRANLTPDLSRRFAVDPSVLTSRVEVAVTPKPPTTPQPDPTPPMVPTMPMMPTMPQPDPMTPVGMPMPTGMPPVPKAEGPTGGPQTPAGPVMPPQAPQPEASSGGSSAPKDESKPLWPRLLLALLVLIVGGGWSAYARSRKAAAAAAAAAKPKKKKPKPKSDE